MALELQKEADDPKLIRPAQSALYQPALALEFFKAAGRPEAFAAGKPIFVEEAGATGMVPEGSRMYLLVEGEVTLSVHQKPTFAIARGEIFGEMGSISQLPRTATATARTDCKVLSLDEKQFQAAAAKAPEFALMLMNIIMNRLRMTIAMLAATKALKDGEARERRVFDDLMLKELLEAMHHRQPQHCPLNKVIMKEGEAGVFMYVVLEGRVVVSIKGKAVEHVSTGGVFGEMALVDQSPRAATATAESDCDLLAITRKDFLDLVKGNPAFGVHLLKAAADRLRSMTAHRG